MVNASASVNGTLTLNGNFFCSLFPHLIMALRVHKCTCLWKSTDNDLDQIVQMSPKYTPGGRIVKWLRATVWVQILPLSLTSQLLLGHLPKLSFSRGLFWELTKMIYRYRYNIYIIYKYIYLCRYLYRYRYIDIGIYLSILYLYLSLYIYNILEHDLSSHVRKCSKLSAMIKL